MATRSLARPTRTVPKATRERVLRGVVLYLRCGDEIEPRASGGLSVPSPEEGRSYRVNLASERCGCLDFRKTRRPCLHIYAAIITRSKGRS